MTGNFEISEVRFLKEGRYEVIVERENGDVKGRFTITVPKGKRKMNSKMESNEQNRNFPILRKLAGEKVTYYCQNISKSLP